MAIASCCAIRSITRCAARRRWVSAAAPSCSRAALARSVRSSCRPRRCAASTTPPKRSPARCVLLHDVTELRGLTRQMSYQATHDALTGLVNRREFERRLAEAIELARSGDAVARAVLRGSRSFQGSERQRRPPGWRQHAARNRQAHARRCPRSRHGGRDSAATSSRCCWSVARCARDGRSPTTSRARSASTASCGRTGSTRAAPASAWWRSAATAARWTRRSPRPIRPAMSPRSRALQPAAAWRCTRRATRPRRA